MKTESYSLRIQEIRQKVQACTADILAYAEWLHACVAAGNRDSVQTGITLLSTILRDYTRLILTSLQQNEYFVKRVARAAEELGAKEAAGSDALSQNEDLVPTELSSIIFDLIEYLDPDKSQKNPPKN